ncbi:MAG TPA: hypothetical protein VFM13_03215 [Gaiellaceae bacterium]|nr:hypothetical protein [Gaiellaceae bacterium]
MLLRPRGRRRLRRFVFVSALTTMLFGAAGAGAGPNDHLNIVPVIYGTLGANGWYVSNVTINWTFDADPPVLESVGCEAKTLSADTVGTQLVCRARNDPNNPNDWVTSQKTLKIDKTVPSVRTVLERQADANDWYNRPLTVAFDGTDATSGVAACTSGRYSGPDNPAALIAGSCSDNAGNVAPSSFSFKYDATPPTIFAVTAKVGNRRADVAWRKSSDTKLVEVARAPGRGNQGESVVYRGSQTGFRDSSLKVGRRYEYRVIGIDDAANRAERKLEIVATGPLLSPAPGAKVTGPPVLIWTPVRRASYYNVQLIRGQKVLSTWPARPGFRLRRTWLYQGRRYRLRPGTYRWYVWPGFGPRSEARYAKHALGSSTFVVTK